MPKSNTRYGWFWRINSQSGTKTPWLFSISRKTKKEAELEKKLADSQTTKQQKDEMTKEAKRELNRKAYEEWLEKKEEQLANQDFLSRSLSTSAINASLPPFYPSSRSIPYRR